jgi:putative ABC transport system permease protein
MWTHYLTIAWRNLMRDKLFAALNIIGLAIGISACMLIWIYVQDELSFDAHHRKADRIFRIQAHYQFGDTKDDFGITPFPIMGALLKEYPDIESRRFALPARLHHARVQWTEVHRDRRLQCRHQHLPNLRFHLHTWGGGCAR